MKYQIGLTAESCDSIIDEKITGVGMIRGEYLCRILGEYYTLDSCRKYVYDYIEKICEVYKGKDVWYRNADFIVEEVNVLRGCDIFLNDNVSILGLRGTRRGLKYEDVFKMELEIIAELSQKHNNLHVLFSYIKDVDELDRCLSLLKELNFKNKFGIMAEIPSVIFSLEDFLSREISNITIGVNDLTSLVLGTYRGTEYHNCNHPAILRCIKECVEKTRNKPISVSVGGIVNKELMKNCENIGVDNFIVNYPLLNEVLDISLDNLPDINLLSEIKQKTKKERIKNRIELYKKFINENS